jgi:lipid-A-disaccharide synthase-like uncharacterized protein
LWTLLGLLGNLLFTGRVLVQWIASEREGKTVVPVIFWWLSLAGASVMIVYGFGQLEIPFVLGYTATLVPYTRNLFIAYRPERPPRNTGIILVCAVLLGCLSVIVFWSEQSIKDGWFFFGLLGNAVFGSRFFLQWVQSESRRRSVMTLPFWYVSLVGSTLLLIYSFIRNDLAFILGFVFTVIPYTRNIILIHRGSCGKKTSPSPDSHS